MPFSPIRRKTRFGEVLNPARGRTTDCALTTNYQPLIRDNSRRWPRCIRPALSSRPTTQLRFAVPAHIAHPHGVPPWHSGEEGVAGAIDRHFANRRLTDSPSTFLVNPAENLLYPVLRGPKPAEPLQDGTFRILAEPSNCIKSPAKRQDFPARFQPAPDSFPRAQVAFRPDPNYRIPPHSRICALFAIIKSLSSCRTLRL
jgi:hypothetical protein